MIHPVVGVFNETQDLFIEALPRVYNENTWRQAACYVWDNNEWKQVGGATTLMIPLMTSDGKYFYTSDNRMLLVRNHV